MKKLEDKAIKLIKKLRKNKSLSNINFGKCFIYNDEVEENVPLDNIEGMISKIDKITEWFLPFKVVSLVYSSAITILEQSSPIENNCSISQSFNFEIIYPSKKSKTRIKGCIIPLVLTKDVEEYKNILITNTIRNNNCDRMFYQDKIITIDNKDTGYSMLFGISSIRVSNPNSSKHVFINRNKDNEFIEQVRTVIRNNMMMSINYFTKFLYDTKSFVVEINNGKKTKKGLKTNPKNSLFKIINIKDLRKNYINKDKTITEGENVRSGYERRRHKRTYRSDRYVNVKGTSVIIESTWIGPSEVIQNETLYKVRLDVGDKPM